MERGASRIEVGLPWLEDVLEALLSAKRNPCCALRCSATASGLLCLTCESVPLLRTRMDSWQSSLQLEKTKIYDLVQEELLPLPHVAHPERFSTLQSPQEQQPGGVTMHPVHPILERSAR